MPEIVVKLEKLSKYYKLYQTPKDRLKEALHPLSKKYHTEFYALKDINLQVKKGEILGIVGRNGSGKSTLLNIISGVLQPSSGERYVNGAISALLELGAGLNPDFTGMQNIYFFGTIAGYDRRQMQDRIEKIIAFADIGQYIDQPLKTYSSGMKARLGFALAINMEPDILILDEVLAVGDALFKRKCYAKMEELFKSGCTVLFVSHSVNTINEICSRVILLDKGQLILEGPPDFVTNHYQKLLFAENGKKREVRDEIIALNNDPVKKQLLIAKPDLVEIPGVSHSPVSQPDVEAVKRSNAPTPKFLPGFKSQSTVVQKNFPVDISGVDIFTMAGERVNVLVLNETYLFSFNVQFQIEAENVIFSFAIKNDKGLTIGAMNTGSGKKGFGNILSRVPHGDEYLITCRFECRLLPGNYFCSIGVRSFPLDGDSIVLTRITDALVFKVQAPANILNKGICHLDQKMEIIPLRNKLLNENESRGSG